MSCEQSSPAEMPRCRCDQIKHFIKQVYHAWCTGTGEWSALPDPHTNQLVPLWIDPEKAAALCHWAMDRSVQERYEARPGRFRLEQSWLPSKRSEFERYAPHRLELFDGPWRFSSGVQLWRVRSKDGTLLDVLPLATLDDAEIAHDRCPGNDEPLKDGVVYLYGANPLSWHNYHLRLWELTHRSEWIERIEPENVALLRNAYHTSNPDEVAALLELSLAQDRGPKS